nr:glycosyltransferase family 2 protein [Azospirillum oleiclasticum]
MPVQGVFEVVERAGVSSWIARGWAFDAEAPDAPVRLRLRCEEGVLGEFLADQRRPGADGAGRWDFALRLPDRLTDGRPHWLSILAAKDGRELPRRTDSLFHPSPLLGRLDGIVDGTLHGWAIDERAPGQPVDVVVTIDGARAGVVTGDLKRPDLAAALGSDGRHGFCFPLPAALFDGRPHHVSARYANTDRALEGGPLEVLLPPALLTARRRTLDHRQTRHREALEEGRLILAREPLNHLADPDGYRRWLAAHEAVIGVRVAAVPGGGPDIRVHPVPTTGDAEGFAAVVAGSGGDAVVLLEPGARLHPAFLPLVQEAMAGGVEIVYCDDDADEDGGDDGGRRHSPRFKPGWDPDRYRAFPYTGRACAIARHRLAGAAAGVARRERPADALAWAAAAVDTALLTVAPERVHHLPYVLHHGRAWTEDPALPGRAVRVRACLDGGGVRADIEAYGQGRLRVRWPLPDPAPAVTLIIPTRDQGPLLKACLDSVRATVRYPRCDIVVVDNDSRDPATLALLDRLSGEPDLRVRRWPGAFNYAALHNAVVAELRTPYVLLLNNDVEAIEPGWLEEMMGHAVRSEVGAVGAKLLYPDGMIQHGGVIVGQQGGADHAQTAFRDGEDGHLHGAMVAQNVSAVTAACMVCRRADYLAVGGMDAAHLQVAFNDVDLCLKLRALGRRIIWTPHARLLHRESATRKALRSPDDAVRELREVEWLRATWRLDRFADPFHSPNLSLGPLSHVDFRWPEPEPRRQG